MYKSNDSYKDFTIKGYASVFNVLDECNDIILPGAFKEASSKDTKLLWQHDFTKPIGKIIDLYEDSYGLFVKAKIINQLTLGQEVISLIKQKIINGLSIGYKVNIKSINKEGRRAIHKLNLWEISIVTFQANKLAHIILEDEYKQLQTSLEQASLTLNKR